ncbi:hypothetical protein BD324DRAFT_630085 [Kockovaella imperatae]|uniref:Uncharacterized protein n=1 Tax=Kockovaella imperatae TaxID=4999 RepID=A0A1Y1UDH1_9TREE|nr:hypothetical protein BD324DRAFT_630085 [Kockovaella imperatae]ORX36081.1 hypothetical protein BD324DRAFT_630085 [Kockovaella imperatae]
MFAAIGLLSLLGSALAGPISIGKRDDVHCGTTSDATLSDCQALVTPEIWNQVFNTGNVCHFTNPLANIYDGTALNLACHENCCVYYTNNQANPGSSLYQSSETLRQAAAGLLGCGDTSANKINGLDNLDGYAICISDGNGCGDCFDDADWAFA